MLPTDTVYGLAALVDVSGAVDRLAHLKGRPAHVPIALLAADVDQARAVARMGPLADRLAAEHWPGPLTLVLDGRDDVGARVGSVDGSVGVRCPDHVLVRAIAAAVGPLATTSANMHGDPTPATAAEVAALFPSVGLVLDGGRCAGEPSTVVDARGEQPVVLRRGPLRLL